MTKTFRAGATGLLLALALAAPAAAATVTVRVEGANTTLVRQVAVEPSDSVQVHKGYEPCPGNSAAGALEIATGGDWSGAAYSFGQAVDVIKGESHVFGSGAYWAFDIDNQTAPEGVCPSSYVPAQGDEILFYAACEGAPAPGCFGDEPLDVRAPQTAAPGAPFTVHVDEFTAGARAVSAGATVSGGGSTAVTGAGGDAAVTLSRRGPTELVATKGGRVRDESVVCVTDGADGFCGTTAPDGTSQPAPHTPVTPASARPDKDPATVTITGIEEGQAFKRGKGPRELRARVEDDPAGLYGVKLSLSRRTGGRCFTFSGKKERFRRARCGRHSYFTVGTSRDVSYLLPKRLGRGRYVLDVVSIDGKLNRDPLARGRNRVVFTVK